ncbi:hypothetical protein XH89_29690 [Bradyrhizobium sp. CCBAU 53340]|uniref:hypothetical protein n=1 Tax=Bradyrhizobium sp. CCBAU 53340 TaxID=1325112 RepID=UPI00188D1102|nr:hypothetical protein [Bradyrhizobium sp. CCBAU 53340]QOZ47192.1 hypothetical protein XH89_29690 [Bradyrhizobium sp. CCBAU 53340]
MKAFLIASLLTTGLAAPCWAKDPGCNGPEFQAFRNDFEGAANANDRNRIVKLISFPVEYWSAEAKHDVQSGPVKGETEFLQRYDTLFTSFMRKHLHSAKLLSLPDGRCALTWHDANSEFTFEFRYLPEGGFRAIGYEVGAY